MRYTMRLQHRWLVALSVSAAVLLAAVGLPHHHDGAMASHPAQSCRVCKIQEDGAAAPAVFTLPQDLTVIVAGCAVCRSTPPRAALVVRRSIPRAPPALS